MRYTNQVVKMYDTNCKQVSKTEARKLFAEGKQIYLHPCNMSLYSGWSSPCPIILSDYVHEIDGNIRMNQFDKVNNYETKYVRSITPESIFNDVVSNFESYNCVQELGKYANFFTPIQ